MSTSRAENDFATAVARMKCVNVLLAASHTHTHTHTHTHIYILTHTLSLCYGWGLEHQHCLANVLCFMRVHLSPDLQACLHLCPVWIAQHSLENYTMVTMVAMVAMVTMVPMVPMVTMITIVIMVTMDTMKIKRKG